MIARGINTSALDNGMLSVGDIGGSVVGWRCLSNGTFDDCMVKLANRGLMDCEKRHIVVHPLLTVANRVEENPTREFGFELNLTPKVSSIDESCCNI